MRSTPPAGAPSPLPSSASAYPSLRGGHFYNAWFVILSFFLLFAVHNAMTKDYAQAAKNFLLQSGHSSESVEQLVPKTAAEKAREAKDKVDEYTRALLELDHLRTELDLVKKVIRESKLYENTLTPEEQEVLWRTSHPTSNR